MVNLSENEIALESHLTEEVNILWTQHVRVAGTKKSTVTELRLIRQKLAERLFAMKNILCIPGRSGRWTSWLSEVKIPRSTADRLVERHAEMSGASMVNVPTGPSSPEEEVEKLLKSLPRLRRVLTTPEMAYLYVIGVIKEFGLNCEDTEWGIMLAHCGTGQELSSEPELEPSFYPDEAHRMDDDTNGAAGAETLSEISSPAF